MSIHDKYLDGRDKVDVSIARLRMNCTGKRVLCAFSGGKDSQCCYHLLKDAGIQFTAQYSITRFEPPELVSFIRANYPDVSFRRAYKMSLMEEIAYRGLPNRWARWCCNAKHKKTDGFDIAVIGVRGEESARRMKSWRTFGRKQDGSYYCCPIFDWTEADVWEYLNERAIPHCCLYDEGFKRIGCVCCPLAPNNMRRDAARWPKTAAVLRNGFYGNWRKALMIWWILPIILSTKNAAASVQLLSTTSQRIWPNIIISSETAQRPNISIWIVVWWRMRVEY